MLVPICALQHDGLAIMTRPFAAYFTREKTTHCGKYLSNIKLRHRINQISRDRLGKFRVAK